MNNRSWLRNYLRAVIEAVPYQFHLGNSFQPMLPEEICKDMYQFPYGNLIFQKNPTKIKVFCCKFATHRCRLPQ